jgi:hypothetical protein
MPDNPNPWLRVVFSAECSRDGTCPVCGADFGECPGPTQEDEFEYRVVDAGQLAEGWF